MTSKPSRRVQIPKFAQHAIFTSWPYIMACTSLQHHFPSSMVFLSLLHHSPAIYVLPPPSAVTCLHPFSATDGGERRGRPQTATEGHGRRQSDAGGPDGGAMVGVMW